MISFCYFKKFAFYGNHTAYADINSDAKAFGKTCGETSYSPIVNTCVVCAIDMCSPYRITESQLYRHGSMASFVFIVWHREKKEDDGKNLQSGY